MHRLMVRAALAALLLSAAPPARAELLEDIVAWVNGEIITLSEYEEEEETQTAEAYRRLAGAELDRWVAEGKKGILLDMIDRKILVHHAKALGFDLDKLGDAIFDSFKDQQGVQSDEEFAKMIESEGMTVAAVKRKLIEMYAPQEVIDVEVRKRLAVSDREVQAFYDANQQQFFREASVTFREIVLLADNKERKAERRAEMEAIRERALAGEDFGALASEVSDAGTGSSGGRLGPLPPQDLSPQLAEVAFQIPVGAISEILDTPYGFHLLQIESRTAAEVQPLDAVREKVREFLEERAYRERLQEFMTRVRGESEWCVKQKYQDLLPIPAPTECETL
jgi:parvulin-like peptidyl-prolyl isomerase